MAMTTLACPLLLGDSSWLRGRLFCPRSPSAIPPRSRLSYQRPLALFGDKTSGDNEKGKDKKFITKEEEPEQYWQTAAEKEGKGPMSTILPYIVILGFLTPFIILGIAFANGWIKVPVR